MIAGRHRGRRRPRLGERPAMSTAGNFPTMPISCAFLPLLRVEVGVLMPARFPAFDTIAKRGVPLSRALGENSGARSAKRKARQASASPLNGRPQSPRGDDDEASYSVLRHTSRQEPIPSPRVELWRCPRPIGALHDVERPFFEFAQISTSNFAASPQIATSNFGRTGVRHVHSR